MGIIPTVDVIKEGSGKCVINECDLAMYESNGWSRADGKSAEPKTAEPEPNKFSPGLKVTFAHEGQDVTGEVTEVDELTLLVDVEGEVYEVDQENATIVE